MLNLNQVQKQYAQRIVLDIKNLTIKEGIHWLKGANGSGKSTLMKIVGGLIPFEGEINVRGIDLKEHGLKYRRLVSYAEAEPLYPEFLSGNDLIHFYHSVRKADKKNSDELISRFGITEYFKNPIGSYSSGMVKKLSLVLAFIGSPKIILLDEPFVTLDVAAVQVLIEAVADFQKQGCNFIFTSHQSAEIEKLPITSQLLVQNNTVCLLS